MPEAMTDNGRATLTLKERIADRAVREEALHKLVAEGFVLEHRQSRGGAFLTIGRSGLRLSRQAQSQLGIPLPRRVYVLRKPGELVILPAPETDQRAYRVTASGAVAGGQFIRRLRGDGWELGRYHAGAGDGFLLITTGGKLT